VTLLHEVIRELERNKLSARLTKCEFFTQQIEFPGMSITQKGVTMKPKSISTLKMWRIPNTVKKLQSFIGFANNLRQFVWEYANLLQPLQKYLKSTTKKIAWSNEGRQEFEKINTELVKMDQVYLHIPVQFD
jgi:hypothetical protein